jgi:nitrate reductase molybdenum cofactor assembly chaperone NarJ/NarW
VSAAGPGSGAAPAPPRAGVNADRRRLLCEEMGVLLRYPGAGCRETARRAAFLLAGTDGESASTLDRFIAAVAPLSDADLEELYTRTFDLNPVCALEVGWHIHGETYERGSFLVEMRDLLRRAGRPEDGELPDHLSRLLPALGHIGADEAEALVRDRILRAVGIMRTGLAGGGNPYDDLLAAVEGFLKAEFAS